MRTILLVAGLILLVYFLNKKIPPDYIFIKTLMSSVIAVLSVLLIAILMLHFSGINI